MRKKTKKATKRVRLAAALRDAIAPQMRGYGFENPTTQAARLRGASSRRDVWARERNGRREEVDVQWLDYGQCRFAINFTTQPLEGFEPTSPDRVRTWRLAFGRIDVSGAWFGRGTIQSTVARAARRLEAVNRYFMEGAPSYFIRPRVDVHDWTRQGSAGVAVRPVDKA